MDLELQLRLNLVKIRGKLRGAKDRRTREDAPRDAFGKSARKLATDVIDAYYQN